MGLELDPSRDAAHREAPARSFRLLVAYDGTSFHGWQEQPGTRTAAGTLRRAIASILGEDVELVGASRTDRGVHAAGQVASFRARSPIPATRIPNALNGVLPVDLRVLGCEEVEASFHARFAAVGKHYLYLIDRSPTPGVFLARRAFHFPSSLHPGSMREAAAVLTGTHDFAAFRSESGGSSGRRTDIVTMRTVLHISVEEAADLIAIEVWGRSFLYKMVRTLAGTLLEAGRGRWSVDRVRAALRSLDRCKAGPTLPAQGLSLEAVYYEVGRMEQAIRERSSRAGIDPWKLL